MAVYTDLMRYRELFANLFRRNFQAKYRGSVLGLAWSLVNPLALLGVYLLVFGLIMGNTTISHYWLYLLTGITCWVFFSASMQTGARSLIDAARIALTLMPMSTEEANKFGIPEDERCRLIRLDDGKVNLALASRAKWYRLASVNIDNGTVDYPQGDNVQAVEQWTPPETWAGLSNALLNRILDVIEEGLPDGERYSGAPSAKTRAAWPIVQKHAHEKTEAQCREIIKAWLKSRLLMVEEYDSRKERKQVEGLRVDPAKRPGTGAQ